MDCSCWQYFWYGIVTALLPSFLVLAVLLGRSRDDGGPTRGT